jgi:hypothetical protein
VNVFNKSAALEELLGQVVIDIDEYPEIYKHSVDFTLPISASKLPVFGKDGKSLNVQNTASQGDLLLSVRIPPTTGNMCGWYINHKIYHLQL